MPPTESTVSPLGSGETYDATEDLIALQSIISSQPAPIIIPTYLKHSLDDLITHLRTPSKLIPPSPPSRSVSPTVASIPVSDLPQIHHNIKLNRKTTLDILYVYHTPNTIIEYPETSENGNIGYLLAMDWKNGFNPTRSFAYSLGEPKGLTTIPEIKRSKPTNAPFHLFDKEGITVPYRVSYSTCQGMKICPFVNQTEARVPHTKASREELSQRLKVLNSEQRRQIESPMNGVFLKTLSYFSALRRHGCGSPLFEPTIFSATELKDKNKEERCRELERRGHPGKTTCSGRLLFEYTLNGRPFIRCEHYNRFSNTDHFIDFTVGHGLMDTEYLAALFSGDVQVTTDLEEDAALDGIGPLSECTTVSNFSSIKVNCSFDHRDSEGKLINPEMVHLECQSKFRLFEPLEKYREECPWALVVCHKAHKHPVPIPSKTPPLLLREITNLLGRLGHALPDLTPRRFLRHPVLQTFLKDRLPNINDPMLLDLHPSLANRDHLRHYINEVRDKIYPEGTGWKGLQYLKDEQDRKNSIKYIRFIGEYSDLGQLDETDETMASDCPLRIVVCMLKENSFRLLNSQYIQSDIGFKRVVGWKEFELGARDEVSRITTTYCRIYTNRQTAEAHRQIFHKIDNIVKEDTGQNLLWRHIHSDTPNADGAKGIFLMTVDQHGGQAKGFGEYLCDVSSELPPKKDLHEQHRYIQDLDAYEHLRRILRLCKIHFIRNIQSCGVSDSVKRKMKDLICTEHDQWNVILREIQDEGGKAAQDWVADKIRSKFAIPAICWEKSYIPLPIWKAGEDTSNIVEQLHEDVNREGIVCTLVGGVQKAYHFDMLKNRTLETLLATGVRPSYQRGHISESTARSLQRKSNVHSKVLERQDNDLHVQNNKLQKAYRQKQSADLIYLETVNRSQSGSTQVEQAIKKKDRAEKAYDKVLNDSLAGIGTGSGKVGILLPSDTPGAQQ